MYRFAIALLLGLSVIPAFADDVTCNSLGPAIAMQRGLNLPLTDRVILVQACQTGVQMREDGVSRSRFNRFIRERVSHYEEFSSDMRQSIAQALTYGFDGDIEGTTVVMGEDIRNN